MVGMIDTGFRTLNRVAVDDIMLACESCSPSYPGVPGAG